MKAALTLIALACAASAASATKCPDGLDFSAHPDGNCNWYYQGTDPSRPAGAAGASASSASDASAGAAALAGVKSSIDNRVVVDASGAPVSNEQRQQQQQQQAQRLNNQNTAGGGVGTGGSVVIEGAQAGSGSSYQYTAWVPMGLSVAASAVPSASTMPIVRRCDARVRVYPERVIGYDKGAFGGLTEVTLGYRDRIDVYLDWDGRPSREPFETVNVYEKDAFGAFVLDPEGAPIITEQRLIGSEVIGGMTALSTTSGASIVANLLDNGRGAAGGVGTSGGMQQQAQVLNVFPCVYATRRVIRVAMKATTTIIYKALKPRAPRPPVKPKAKPCPVCCAPAAAVCPAPGIKPAVL